MGSLEKLLQEFEHQSARLIDSVHDGTGDFIVRPESAESVSAIVAFDAFRKLRKLLRNLQLEFATLVVEDYPNTSPLNFVTWSDIIVAKLGSL